MFWKINYFVQDFIKKYGVSKTVLDVGSRDINGNIWTSFREASLGMPEKMVGIDFIKGKNVDIVMNAHDLVEKFGENSFDLVVCCETLEHDNKPWLTIEAMRKVVKPGGFMLITVPGIHFFRHDFPSDYYRYTTSAMEEVMFEGWQDVHVEEYFDETDPCQHKPNNSILGYGRKPWKDHE